MNKWWNRVIFILGIVFLVIAILSVYQFLKSEQVPEEEIPELVLQGQEENEAEKINQEISIGWNLGNSLDSVDYKKKGIQSSVDGMDPADYYETYWGNPKTTQDMIQAIKNQGFKAVRIPVSYYDHMDNGYVIDEDWLDRIEEVVDYVLDEDMYCVLDIHHEAIWLRADSSRQDVVDQTLATVWAQIAKKFASYDERLIFEGFNEVINPEGEWTDVSQEDYEAFNQLNQTFVDTIRSGDAYNKERVLMVQTYGASTNEAELKNFVLPKDTIDNRLIVSVHTYTPTSFTWMSEDLSGGDTHETWNEKDDVQSLSDVFESLDTYFSDQDVPISITEFGAKNKNNTQDRIDYVESMLSETNDRGISCFWWDDGGVEEEASEVTNFALFNRSDTSWYFPTIADALVGKVE